VAAQAGGVVKLGRRGVWRRTGRQRRQAQASAQQPGQPAQKK
jgi:hypothetical protein